MQGFVLPCLRKHERNSMITAISGLSFKTTRPQNNSKTDFKTNPLNPKGRADSFELQNKSNPSFGRSIVPRKAILACCKRFSARMEKTESIDELRGVSERFLEIFKKVLYNPKLTKEPAFEHYQDFRHELLNRLTHEKWYILTDNHIDIPERYSEMAGVSNAEYLNQYKQAFTDTVGMIKGEIEYEKFTSANLQTLNAKAIFERLRKHKLRLCPFSIEGLSLLKGKKIKEPEGLDCLIRQPFSNSQKYGEGKPFKIVIEKAMAGEEECYYASFINPDTTPIPDAEIDKILQGNSYRASNAIQAGIEGEGFGFGYIIRTLRREGYEQNIPNLIEKGRKKGVCVRVPIIGIV